MIAPLRAASLARRAPLVALVLVSACSKPWKDAEPLLDTGWFAADDGLCEEVVLSTVPADGDAEWYWRDPLTVLVEAPSDAYEVRLVDDLGAELPTKATPDDTGLRITVEVPEGLRPSTRHTLQLTDCRGTREVSFTTSSLGLPITDGAASLNDRTWMLDLVHADWLQPSGFGPVIAGLFNLPAIIGTTYVDDDGIDLLGALGASGGDVVVQDPDYPTWDIPLGDFDGAPWFSTHADRVVWVINQWSVPIEDFALAGTFAPDGRTIGGMVLTGVMDSRKLGGAINKPNDDYAICDLVSGFGVPCIPCADDTVVCLAIGVRSLLGIEQPGVTIRPIGPE
jgi:hypothetical protein